MNITDRSKADKIARGAGSCIDGVVDDVKNRLGISDEELSCIRPTVICSVGQKDDISVGLGLVSTMCRMKGKNLSLFFHSDGKIEVAASR